MSRTIGWREPGAGGGEGRKDGDPPTGLWQRSGPLRSRLEGARAPAGIAALVLGTMAVRKARCCRQPHVPSDSGSSVLRGPHVGRLSAILIFLSSGRVFLKVTPAVASAGGQEGCSEENLRCWTRTGTWRCCRHPGPGVLPWHEGLVVRGAAAERSPPWKFPS